MHNISTWNNWGGLNRPTKRGILQMIELGRFVRSRYGHLLSANYDSNEVYASYSRCDDTFLSALFLLNGIYGNYSDYRVDEFKCQFEELINNEGLCPRLAEIKREKLKSNELDKLNTEKRILLLHLSILTEIYMDNYLNISLIADSIRIELLHNLTMASWVNIYKKDLFTAMDFFYKFFFGDKQIAKFISGDLLKKMMDNMKVALRTTNKIYTKFGLFMTKDIHICSILTLLNHDCDTRPNYASAIVFELFEMVTNTRNKKFNKHFVKIYLKNNQLDENITLKSIPIDDCEAGYECPFPKLYASIEKYLVADIKKECDLDDYTIEKEVFKIMCYLIFFILLGLVLVKSCYRKRR